MSWIYVVLRSPELDRERIVQVCGRYPEGIAVEALSMEQQVAIVPSDASNEALECVTVGQWPYFCRPSELIDRSQVPLAICTWLVREEPAAGTRTVPLRFRNSAWLFDSQPN